MNEIFKRRSIRKYQSKEVEEEKIVKILKAAFAAPSARNEQPWEFYVIQDKKMIEELSQISEYCAFAKDAPLIIIPCFKINEERYEFNLIDLSAATENILLEVTALGLGACWCAVSPRNDRVEAVEKIINIKEGLRAFALIPIGYPAEDKEGHDIFDKDRIHYR